MWTFLAIGTIGFWIALVFAFILITALIENSDSGGSWSTFICGLTLVLFYLFGAGQELSNLGSFILSNPLVVVVAILAYIVLGSVWSIIKWYFYVVQARTDYINNDYSGKIYTISDIKNNIPKASSNKGRITSWMFYWPFSVIITLFNEPIKNIFNKIYYKFTSSFDKISNNVFMNNNDIEKLLNKEKKDNQQTTRKG